MQPALAVHEERQIAVGDLVVAVPLAVDEGELPVHRGQSIVRGAHGVDQPMAARVLVVVQIAGGALALGPGVQRVDEHGGDRARPRDLDAGLLEIVGHRRNPPRPGVGLADRRTARPYMLPPPALHARGLGVRIPPLFGRWGSSVAETLFACSPIREKERDLWIRLTGDDQRRALADSRVRPHRRFSRKGWIELDVEGIEDMGRAVRWLRRGYTAAARGVPDEAETED